MRHLSRRRWVFSTVLLLAVSTACERPPSSLPPQAADGIPAERSAGTWKTWVLASPDQIQVPPPPGRNSEEAKAEVAELTPIVHEMT